MASPALTREALESIGVKYSKNGYIIASAKNLSRLLSTFGFSKVTMSKFDGQTDGMGAHEDTFLGEAKAKAYEIICADRFGRGIAVYESTATEKACISVGDCCYDVNFYVSDL